MNVSVLVATFGSRQWRERGDAVASSVEDQGAHEVLRLHRDHDSLASVRNDLAAEAVGDWLCFVDGDDRIDEAYLYWMERAWRLVSTASCLLVPSVQYVLATGQAASAAKIPSWGRDLLDVNCCVVGTLVPRDLFLRVGGFRETLADGTRLSALEDWDLFVRCVLAGADLIPVPDAVYIATRSPNGRNRDQSLYRAIRAEHEHAWSAR